MVARWLGCDEDCFNCPYPDCYKPDNKMHTAHENEKRGRKNGKSREGNCDLQRDAIDEALAEMRLQ